MVRAIFQNFLIKDVETWTNSRFQSSNGYSKLGHIILICTLLVELCSSDPFFFFFLNCLVEGKKGSKLNCAHVLLRSMGMTVHPVEDMR